MFSLEKKRWQWLAMLFLAFVWGASFILMKKGLLAFTDTQVAAIRIFFAFLVLLPMSIRSLRKVTRNNWLPLNLAGYLGNFFPAFLFTLAETKLSSSLAGILNSLTPFFTLIIGIALFGNRPRVLQYVGITVGMLGAVLLITNGNFNSFGDINSYAMLIVLATFFYGINSNIIKFRLHGLTGVEITSLVFFFVGPVAGIVLFCTDLSAAYQSQYFWPSLVATLTLSLFGSVITLFVFNSLVHKAGPIFASSVTYIIPIFALMWGILDGEILSLLQVSSMVIIILGVYLSSLRRR
jgi:drug/metabolite transporter (DMT)-like permease